MSNELRCLAEKEACLSSGVLRLGEPRAANGGAEDRGFRYLRFAVLFHNNVGLDFSQPFLMEAEDVLLRFCKSFRATLRLVMGDNAGRLVNELPIPFAQFEA